MEKEKENEKVLQQLWRDVEKEGFTALKKEHVNIIIEEGKPSDIAALIINGYTEPVKYNLKPTVSYSRADKLADKYSRFSDYFDKLKLAELIDKKEKDFTTALYNYRSTALEVISYLKDYLYAKSIADSLNISSNPENSVYKKPLKEFLVNINNINHTEFFPLKVYRGKVTLSNEKNFKKAWKKRCLDLLPYAIILKTYLEVYKKWLTEKEMIRYAPSSIIKAIYNPDETMFFSEIPEEYYITYQASTGEDINGYFPVYSSVITDPVIKKELNTDLDKLIRSVKLDRL